jgi:hypothetical protein
MGILVALQAVCKDLYKIKTLQIHRNHNTNIAKEIHQKNAEYQRLTFEFNPELELHMPSDRRSWGAIGFLVLILHLDVHRKTPRNT